MLWFLLLKLRHFVVFLLGLQWTCAPVSLSIPVWVNTLGLCNNMLRDLPRLALSIIWWASESFASSCSYFPLFFVFDRTDFDSIDFRADMHGSSRYLVFVAVGISILSLLSSAMHRLLVSAQNIFFCVIINMHTISSDDSFRIFSAQVVAWSYASRTRRSYAARASVARTASGNLPLEMGAIQFSDSSQKSMKKGNDSVSVLGCDLFSSSSRCFCVLCCDS